ncbi:MAG: biopolymer transporter ExbD [Planctomycetota bacterium]
MRIRRGSPEPRLEMAPLIDVVFLLLTFFVFAMVLMVRVETLGVRLPELQAGESASSGEIISIVVNADGAIALDGEPIERASLLEIVRSRLERTPDARVALLLDVDGRVGEALAVFDELRRGGVENVDVLGRPGGE